MGKVIGICFCLFLWLSPLDSSSEVANVSCINCAVQENPCEYKGRRLYKGPKGGCYYINSNGNKTYVDKSFCNCGSVSKKYIESIQSKKSIESIQSKKSIESIQSKKSIESIQRKIDSLIIKVYEVDSVRIETQKLWEYTTKVKQTDSVIEKRAYYNSVITQMRNQAEYLINKIDSLISVRDQIKLEGNK